MSEPDKTVVFDSNEHGGLKEHCPICDTIMRRSADRTSTLFCPVCHFVQKPNLEIAPGNIIGDKYRVLSHLESGGVGDLFLCHPLDDVGVRYVLKVLRLGDAASRQRFRREARVLASLEHHDNIANLIDHWEIGDDVFIVMEYVNGKNLCQLKLDYVFDETATLQVAKDVVKVLSYIWKKHAFIHRDIKPENIMLDEKFHLKLLDFGLSKSVTSCTDITMANLGLGTPGYMSPEQFKDSRSVDFRADIFSLGATMFYLLTDETPFGGKDTAEVYRNTISGTPPDFHRFRDRCSPQCVALIRRMMQSKPENRYSDYDELMTDIRRLLK